ncbi:MAG: rRNA pseudouridine synthase, partial [Rhizobiales bacterium]|nr:rRNA pseudouridine synthase [Hyphomicrobiales bacterium]
MTAPSRTITQPTGTSRRAAAACASASARSMKREGGSIGPRIPGGGRLRGVHAANSILPTAPCAIERAQDRRPAQRRPVWRRGGMAEASGTAGERIAKVMARAGLCSRRDAEAWIADGRVSVNGAVIASPALNVGPADRVVVDGRPLPTRERTRLFLYHKPRGLVTTHADPEDRPTIFERLPKDL